MKKNFFGLLSSPYDKRDYIVEPFLKDIKELPTKYDLTDKQSPIKNQGNEGACVGFAGTAVKEYQEKIDYSLEGNDYIDLSERFLYEECKKKSGHKEGSTLVACAYVLANKGICEEGYWKYIPKNPQQPLPGAYHNAMKFKVQSNYVKIYKEADLKNALVKYGAILIGVKVYDNWYKNVNGHIPDLNWWGKFLSFFGVNILGGHAITLVGYDDETQEYKFKNSWSENWGDKGYGYISYKHMKGEAYMDGYIFVDIDDPEEWKQEPIKRIKDLPFWKRIWIRKRQRV